VLEEAEARLQPAEDAAAAAEVDSNPAAAEVDSNSNHLTTFESNRQDGARKQQPKTTKYRPKPRD